MTAQVTGSLPHDWVLIEEYKPAFVARPLRWETPFPPLITVEVLGTVLTDEEWPLWAEERMDEMEGDRGGANSGRGLEGKEAWRAFSHDDGPGARIVVQRYRHLPTGDVLLVTGRVLRRDWAKMAGPFGISLASFFAPAGPPAPRVAAVNDDSVRSRQQYKYGGLTIEGRFDV